MMDKHFQEYNKIMSIKDKICSIVNGSRIVKSGDKNAIQELEKKIFKRENLQKEMKKANAHYRRYKTMKGYKNLSDEEASQKDIEIKSSYSWEQQPYPSYELRGNNQEIHRLKSRLEALKKEKEKPTTEIKNKYFKVVENTELMKLQLFFDEKPSKEIREILKKKGCFNWSSKNNCWQRQLTNNARYSLEVVLSKMEKLENKQILSVQAV